MPTVKISAMYGISVELTDDETSIEDLSAEAIALFGEAHEINGTASPGPASAGGFTQNRWFADHNNPNYMSSVGFPPIKAKEDNGGVG